MTRSFDAAVLASLAAIVIATSASGQSRNSSGEIRMGVGSQKVLTVPSMGTLSVTPEGVVALKRIGNKYVLLVGLAEGVARVEVSQGSEPPLNYGVTVAATATAVVAAVDIAQDTVVTSEMLSQQSFPTQLVTSAAVKPDAAPNLVNLRVRVPLKAGDMVLWSHFEKAQPPIISPK
jgi:hypothetical protein